MTAHPERRRILQPERQGQEISQEQKGRLQDLGFRVEETADGNFRLSLLKAGSGSAQAVVRPAATELTREAEVRHTGNYYESDTSDSQASDYLEKEEIIAAYELASREAKRARTRKRAALMALTLAGFTTVQTTTNYVMAKLTPGVETTVGDTLSDYREDFFGFLNPIGRLEDIRGDDE